MLQLAAGLIILIFAKTTESPKYVLLKEKMEYARSHQRHGKKQFSKLKEETGSL